MGNPLKMKVYSWKKKKNIYKQWVFHCHVWLPKGKTWDDDVDDDGDDDHDHDPDAHLTYLC